jgi:hypothetical protein
VFDKLRKREPNFRDRLAAIDGNILDQNLGIFDQLEFLQENIHIVFHLAGTANFDQDLKYFN